jgi:hypothetical protein
MAPLLGRIPKPPLQYLPYNLVSSALNHQFMHSDVQQLTKPNIVENLNCLRSTCFLPSMFMSCRSNLVPWYFSDTVLPCANPIVCSHPLLGSSSDLDMTVLRYGEGSNAEVEFRSILEKIETVLAAFRDQILKAVSLHATMRVCNRPANQGRKCCTIVLRLCNRTVRGPSFELQ